MLPTLFIPVLAATYGWAAVQRVIVVIGYAQMAEWTLEEIVKYFEKDSLGIRGRYIA